MKHLTEEILNEYLDAELAPAARAAADGHLSACAGCRTRLEALRGLFVELESLPDLAPGRELAPAVVAAVRKPGGVPRVVRWMVLLQALAAAAILALAWPFLLPGPVAMNLLFSIRPVFPTPAELAGLFVQPWLDWGRVLVQQGRPAVFSVPLSIQLDPPAVWITLALVSACLLWLVGNGLLLRPRAGSYKRRHS